MCASLDDSFEKIHVLQRQMREQDMQMKSTENILERLKRENDTLSERLESVCFHNNLNLFLHLKVLKYK